MIKESIKTEKEEIKQTETKKVGVEKGIIIEETKTPKITIPQYNFVDHHINTFWIGDQ